MWCTRKENESHKLTHGTLNMGDKCYGAKLKKHHVLRIREMVSDGVRWKLIASKFKISEKYIWELKARKTWTHI